MKTKSMRYLSCHSTWPWTFVHYSTPLDVWSSHIAQWSIQFEDKVSPKICDAEFCKSFIVVFQNGPNIIWFWNSHINIHIVQRRGEVGGQTHVTTVIGYIWGPKSATWSTSLPLVLQMSIKCTILRAVLLFHIDQTFNVNTWPSLESSATGSPWSTQASPLEAKEPIAARCVLLVHCMQSQQRSGKFSSPNNFSEDTFFCLSCEIVGLATSISTEESFFPFFVPSV